MQNKPNFLDAQMNVRSAITMNYERLTMNYANKNKANTKPIQSQSNPTCSELACGEQGRTVEGLEPISKGAGNLNQ